MKRMRESKLAKKAGYVMFRTMFNRKGMELVQVAILIAIAVTVGLLFSSQIAGFVNKVFGHLMESEF